MENRGKIIHIPSRNNRDIQLQSHCRLGVTGIDIHDVFAFAARPLRHSIQRWMLGGMVLGIHFVTHSLWMNTMNRCLPMPIVRFLRVLILILVWTSSYSPSPASTQTLLRQFPKAAKRGTLVVTAPPEVMINGSSARLSPGARIKGVNNMTVMSGTLVGSSMLVNYVRNAQGLIHEVWILSAEEAQEERSGMEVVTNFIFSSDANKPKTDDGKTPFDQLPRYPRQ